jgi:polyhydroxyalkanoate synthesis regulator phasin
LKIEDKIVNELQKKIDKIELRRAHNSIRKKIDKLEDKVGDLKNLP